MAVLEQKKVGNRGSRPLEYVNVMKVLLYLWHRLYLIAAFHANSPESTLLSRKRFPYLKLKKDCEMSKTNYCTFITGYCGAQ